MLQTSDHVFWYISRLENQTEKLARVSHRFCVKKASLFYQGGLLNTAEATAMFQKVWETWDHSTCWASIKQEPISKDLLIAGWRCMKTMWKLIFRLSFRVWILNMDAFLLLDNLNLRQQNNTRCELWRTSCSFNDDFPWTKALLNFHVCWGEPPAKQDFRSLGASCWEYEQGDEQDIDWLNSVDGFVVERSLIHWVGFDSYSLVCSIPEFSGWMDLGGPDLAIINHKELIMTISVCFQSSIGSLRIEEYSPYITRVGRFWQKKGGSREL